MTITRQAKGSNPLVGWQLDPASVTRVGKGLQRPECILAERDGSLWVADARGGVTWIKPDGSQALVTQTADKRFDLVENAKESLLVGTLPNGLAFAENGDILIANFGTDRLEVMTRAGKTDVLLDTLDGVPIGKTNFVLRDRKGRLWVTVSTRAPMWDSALNSKTADGYIILIDDRGPRIVADGFHFTNEIRLDREEQWLYVAETTAKRVSRLRVHEDGSLSNREVYGPSSLGDGLVDGIAFDEYGNLWATMVFADRLVAITPEGDLLNLSDDGDREATRRFEDAFASGNVVDFDVIKATGGPLCTWTASITFGGKDLKTAYLGGLWNDSIPSFRSPVAGLPMVHW